MAAKKRARRVKVGRPSPAEVAWLRDLEIVGHRYLVEAFFRAEDGTNPRPYYGVCRPEDNRIEVLVEDGVDFTYDSLFHEILHSIWATLPIRHAIRTKISKQRLTPAQLKWLEETVCYFFAPAILAVFRGAGWLTLPPLPENPRRRRP